jgi:hypothetical protein
VQPTDEACGTFGGVCQACGENKKCELGACVPAAKQGCGCSEVEGLSAILLALATMVRGRRHRVVCWVPRRLHAEDFPDRGAHLHRPGV